MLNGSEAWRLTENMKWRVKSIYLISRFERIRNEEIKQPLGIQRILIKDIEREQLTHKRDYQKKKH